MTHWLFSGPLEFASSDFASLLHSQFLSSFSFIYPTPTLTVCSGLQDGCLGHFPLRQLFCTQLSCTYAALCYPPWPELPALMCKSGPSPSLPTMSCYHELFRYLPLENLYLRDEGWSWINWVYSASWLTWTLSNCFTPKLGLGVFIRMTGKAYLKKNV